MINEVVIKQGTAAVYRNEVYNMVVDRVRQEVSNTSAAMQSISVPSPDLMTLARVIINGEGEFTIRNQY